MSCAASVFAGVATKQWVCLLQLMDLNLILPGGAIVADNTLMKAGPALFFSQRRAGRLAC